MIEYYLSGALLRGVQVFIDASVWIAFGCFIAAIFRNMLGTEKTCSLFGNDSRYGLLVGWGIGMLLPVCSLGVIPIVRELHRAGVKQGTIVAFGLTAPLFNPLSILYGLSMSDPIAIVIFSAVAMVIVTGLGAFWGKFVSAGSVDGVDADIEANRISTSGIRRSLAVLYAASTAMVGPSFLFIIIGVTVSAVASVVFENGSLQGATEPDSLFAPAFMACFITPVYSTPLLAMSQIGGMFQHGNSVGAAFSLLVLGAGVNVGLFCWFGTAFGVRRMAIFVGLLMATTIMLAYVIDKPLYPNGVVPSGHTHAFDIYTHPFHRGDSGTFAKALSEIAEHYQKGGSYGVGLLGVLVLTGVVFRCVEMRWDLQAWFQSHHHAPSTWDIALPTWVIAVVACTCLIVVSVFGTFLYYPPPASLLGDLSAINANCVLAARTGDREGVEKWVLYCDDLSRRLEVGVFLRTGSVSEFKRVKASVYREKLDEIRDDIVAGRTSKTKEQSMELHQCYLQLNQAFRPPDATPSAL